MNLKIVLGTERDAQMVPGRAIPAKVPGTDLSVTSDPLIFVAVD